MNPSYLHKHGDWALHVATDASATNVVSSGLDGVMLNGASLPVGARALQCAMDANGARAAVALRDGTVRIFETATHKELNAFSGGPGLPEACGVALSGGVTAACYTSGSSHRVALRGAAGAELGADFTGLGRGVALSDAGRLAFVGNGHELYVADVSRGPGARDALLRAEGEGDMGLALGGAGNLLAVADARTLRLMDVRLGSAGAVTEIADYSAPGKYGRCALSRDATRLVASQAAGFGVWDLRFDATRCATLSTGRGGFNMGCAVTHSGAAAVTAATDGAVRLWPLLFGAGRFLRSRETTEDVRWWRNVKTPVVRSV